MKRLIALGSAILLLAILAAWWTNSRQPKPIVLIPTLTGKPEYCLTCHSDLPEISPSHPIKTLARDLSWRCGAGIGRKFSTQYHARRRKSIRPICSTKNLAVEATVIQAQRRTTTIIFNA